MSEGTSTLLEVSEGQVPDQIESAQDNVSIQGEESQEDQVDNDNEETKPEEKEDHSKESRVQKRIDKLTREKYQLKGELEAMRKMMNQNPQDQEPRANTNSGKPQKDQFASTEDYLEALTDYNERLVEDAPKRIQAQQSERKVEADWDAKIKEARKEFEDYDEALDNVANIHVPNEAIYAIKSSEYGHKILYHLAKNPEQAEKLSKMHPAAAAREIGKLEAKFEASATAAPKPKVTKAPDPINPVGSRGKSEFDHLTHPERYSADQWRRMERERVAKQNKR